MPGRYLTSIIDEPVKYSTPVPRHKNREYTPKHRLITYRPDDREYGDTRVGQVPPVYRSDHQEVLLPSGYYCDMAHILAGLDAFNYPEVVSPLPGFLLPIAKWFPHVDSNADVVTWLGDIASSSGDFLFKRLKILRIYRAGISSPPSTSTHLAPICWATWTPS